MSDPFFNKTFLYPVGEKDELNEWNAVWAYVIETGRPLSAENHIFVKRVNQTDFIVMSQPEEEEKGEASGVNIRVSLKFETDTEPKPNLITHWVVKEFGYK